MNEINEFDLSSFYQLIPNETLPSANESVLQRSFKRNATNATTIIYDDSCLSAYDPSSSVSFFEFWTNGILLNLVGLLGILGNILSMIILSRPQMRSSINYLLIGLARCDTVLILTSMLLFGIPAIHPYTGYLEYYYYYLYPIISPIVYPIAMSAQTASVYLTLTVTLERYVAVCHPLRARALCTYGRAKIYVIVIIIFALLYNIPRFWEVGVQSSDHEELGEIFCIMASDLRANSLYIKIYIHWLYMIFIYFLPFTSIAVFNMMIYQQVRKANRERQRLSRTEKREIGLATMLIIIVIIFFICNVLALITNILEAFYGIIKDELVKTSNLLVTINSSVNFIIYVIFGEKFKRIFLLLFCKGRIGRDSPDGLIHDDSSFSNGDGSNRNSGRFQRVGTTRSSTKMSNSTLGSGLIRSQRTIRTTRAPSPGPIVYYPARESLPRIINPPVTRSKSMISHDWSHENGNGITMDSSAF